MGAGILEFLENAIKTGAMNMNPCVMAAGPLLMAADGMGQFGGGRQRHTE